MTGAALSLTFDDVHMRGALADIEDLGADPRPLLDDIGAYGVASTGERFELGVDPAGVPWAMSFRARAEGGKTLVDSGQLVGSLTHNVIGEDAVEWGSNKIYAAIHQEGGTIRAKDGGVLRFTMGQREVFAASVDIPKRSYLGLSRGDRTAIFDLVADHLGRITAYWGA